MDMMVQTFFNEGISDQFDAMLHDMSVFSEYMAAAHDLEFDENGNLKGTLVVQFGACPEEVAKIDPNNAVELAKGAREAAEIERDECGECNECPDECRDEDDEDLACEVSKLKEELAEALEALGKVLPLIDDDSK